MTSHKFFGAVALTCLVLLGIIVFTPSVLMLIFTIASFFGLDQDTSLKLALAIKVVGYSAIKYFSVLVAVVGGLVVLFIASTILARLTDKRKQAIPTTPLP